MFDDARKFFEEIAEELDEFKEKVEETFSETLPELIEKWDIETRSMTDYEIAEAKKVFGESLDTGLSTARR